jgi:uncharacterized protein YecT (DUF1311 family)
MRHLIVAIYTAAFYLLSSNANAASFDCAKASTLIEKTICSDAKLSEFDSQLMQSYKKALASSPNASGLKTEQKAWLTGIRNKCTDTSCLTRVYSERISALTSDVGGVSNLKGGWPSVNTAALVGKGASIVFTNPQERERFSKLVGNNTDLDDYLTATIFSDEDASEVRETGDYLVIISKGIIRRDTGPMDGAYAINKTNGKPTAILVKDSKFTVVGATLESLPPPLKAWAIEHGAEYPSSAAATDEKKSPMDIALAKNAAKVSALGFPKQWLKATIYVQGDLSNSPPRAFIPLENWLALLFDNSKFTKITAINYGKSKGVLLKVKGAESVGFLFIYDEGDLFPSHVVNGDDAVALETENDKYGISMTIMQLAAASVQRK